MLDFVYPFRDGTSVLRSVVNAMDRVCEVDREPPEYQAAMEWQVLQEPEAEPPDWVYDWRDPSPFEILMAVLETSEKSNAGYPYCLSGKKKQDYALSNFESVMTLVVARLRALRQMVDRGIDGELPDPVVIFEAGLQDAFLVIDKNQVMETAKLERQRSVACGSVVDEVVNRLMDGPVNRGLKETWGEHPSCVGIGFDADNVDIMFQAMRMLVFELQTGDDGDPVESNDTSGYEYTLIEEDFVRDAQVRARVQGFRPGSRQERLYILRGRLLARKVYVFTNGAVLAQTRWGKQPSGQLNTSATNTRTRSMRSTAVSLRVGDIPGNRTVGDDCNERWRDENDVLYKEMWGMLIKDRTRGSSKRFVACSHLFIEGRPPKPLNMEKALVTLLSKGPSPEDYMVFCAAYRNADGFWQLVEELDRLGWPTDQTNNADSDNEFD